MSNKDVVHGRKRPGYNSAEVKSPEAAANVMLNMAEPAEERIDTLMEAQKDLVEIVHTLKQVVCVKG